MTTGASNRPQHPEELLASYIEDALDAPEHAEVDRHLAGCQRCRDDVRLAGSARTALRELPEVAPPADMRAAVRRALDADPRHPAIGRHGTGPRASLERRSRAAGSRWVAGIAAAAVIVGLVAVVVPRLSSSGGVAPSRAPAGAGKAEASPAAGPAGPPLVERQDVDYDAEGIAALAADVAASPSVVRSSQRAGESVQVPGAEDALTCVHQWTSSAKRAVPVRIIEASYQGRPAYLGVAYQSAAGGGAARILVWVLAQQGCRLISFSQRAV